MVRRGRATRVSSTAEGAACACTDASGPYANPQPRAARTPAAKAATSIWTADAIVSVSAWEEDLSEDNAAARRSDAAATIRSQSTRSCSRSEPRRAPARSTASTPSAAPLSRLTSPGRSPTATSARRATPTACSAEVTALHIRCRRSWANHQPGDPIVATVAALDARRRPWNSSRDAREARIRARAARYRRRTRRTTRTAAAAVASMSSSEMTPAVIRTSSTTSHLVLRCS